MYVAPLNCKLNMVKIACFILCDFYHNKKAQDENVNSDMLRFIGTPHLAGGGEPRVWKTATQTEKRDMLRWR